jgi:hypothetical protein
MDKFELEYGELRCNQLIQTRITKRLFKQTISKVQQKLHGVSKICETNL